MTAKFSSRIPWREKLERLQEPRVVRVPPRMQARFVGADTMLIPRPLDVDALIRKIPKGKLVTVTQLREELARRCKADVTCPLTTGIFVRIAAEASEEDRRSGKKSITPYWRVVTHEGRLNAKFPGGLPAQKKKLTAEGHHVENAKGSKPPVVKNFEKKLLAHFPAE